MPLLRHRNFAFLWASRLVSRLGDWMLDVALPVWVYHLTGSATLLGALIAIETLPAILLAPFAGVLVDRWNWKWVAVVSNVLLGASVLLLFLVRSPQQLWLIVVVALLNACVGVFLAPAQTALVPQLVARDDLLQANSIITLTIQGMRLVGPAVGAAILALAGPYLAFGLDAASFLLAALLMLGVHLRRERSDADDSQVPPRNLWHEAWAGLHLIRRNVILRTTLLVWAVMMAAAGVVAAVLVVFVREALGGSDAQFGLLLSTQGLGW